jgi:hypothetical protein
LRPLPRDGAAATGSRPECRPHRVSDRTERAGADALCQGLANLKAPRLLWVISGHVGMHEKRPFYP